MNISLFKSVKESSKSIGVMKISDFFNDIKNGRWQDEVLKYRTIPVDKIEERKNFKKKMPGVTPSAIFKERNESGISSHSGIICIDIDAKDQVAEINIDILKDDSYVYAIHSSISAGSSYAVYFKIDKNKHLDAFEGLKKYLFDNYFIVIDVACKDKTRLRIVSYDPDIYVNEKAKFFKQYVKKTEKKQIAPVVFVKSDFDRLVNEAKSMNLFDDYKDYIECGFALASEFGAGGRDYFHALCSSSSKYNRDKADKDYDRICNRNKTGISISTLYFIFKQNNLEIVGEKTKKFAAIARYSENPKEYLEKNNLKDDENLIEKFKDKRTSFSGELGEIASMIKMNNIKFNEVIRNYDFNGIEMTDRVLAEFYTKVWDKIDDGISKDKVFTLIQSRDITPSFNPILDWFQKYKNLKYENEFKKLVKCFDYEAEIYYEGKKTDWDDYLEIFLKKWLLGIIASAHGTYSLMILVLIGEQGTNKTRFFRNLLPSGLSSFYAESNLDEGKDSEILMTKKLLIIDDEFGGKNKKDANKLKRLTSQQTFSIRVPYGRVSEDLNRLAVLGGTSNELEIINDPTGNRRIIPVNLKNFKFEEYEKIDKKKLFIELYHEYLINPESWFLTKDEIFWLNEATIRNTETMSENELIASHFYKNEHNYMTCTDIMMTLHSVYPILKTNTKRIGQALAKNGYYPELLRVNDKVSRIYRIMAKSVTNTTL